MTILYRTRPSYRLVHLQSLAKCFGITAELIDVHGYHSLISALRELVAAEKMTVVLDIDGLEDSCDGREAENARQFLSEHETSVLFLTAKVDQSRSGFLGTLTDGLIREVKSLDDASSVNFPEASSALSQELASQSYPRKKGDALGLIVSSSGRADIVMTLDQSPAFVHVRMGRANVFIWSTSEIFDVFQPLAAEREFEEATDKYIPAIIFLRSAFRDQCWHSPNPGAGIVIDDPLLKKTYGFINFPQLLRSARKHGYHVTLAFIPWNHWRSRAKDVKMFLEHSDCFSICAHGCDHTSNEFKSADYEALLRKNFVARQRMEGHGERTGLSSEPLFVCPQEQYSLQAMRAFSNSRQFLGLVCTACMPRNLTTPQICGADLLLPAQDSFFGFPVFKRHYSNGMEVFAMALFLGKPAILVEHHEFFRNGLAGAEEFARRLAELRPDLKWKSLAETVTCTHARRWVSEGRWEVRFFTDTFQLKHELKEPAEYRLLRRIPEATVVERVLVGGKEVQFSRENGFLTFETQAYRPQTLFVQVKVAPIKPTKAYLYGVKYQASVALRRGLSELRDNIIARNRFALRAGRLVIKALKGTSS